ncbi:2864_t:CDS:2 [Gigaspora rosea]|nr:2864_t:CDS:2 [Gigaspora rosea]
MEREEKTKDPEDCYRFGIGEEDRKNKNGVTEFWKLVREKDQTKGPTEKEYTEIEETSIKKKSK